MSFFKSPFTETANFIKGLFGFVQTVAPEVAAASQVAEEVGTVIGNPAVVAGAKTAEAIASKIPPKS